MVIETTRKEFVGCVVCVVMRMYGKRAVALHVLDATRLPFCRTSNSLLDPHYPQNFSFLPQLFAIHVIIASLRTVAYTLMRLKSRAPATEKPFLRQSMKTRPVDFALG
jgi:hypothetical protein